MKRSRFSEEHIIGILRQAEAGMRVVDLCRRHGISDATFYKWRPKYGGMDVSDAMRLRQLEEENARLRKMVAEQALDISILKDVLSKTSEARCSMFKRHTRPPSGGPVRHWVSTAALTIYRA